jgi:hypothetical protein
MNVTAANYGIQPTVQKTRRLALISETLEREITRLLYD